MSSTYTTDLKIELITPGEQNNSWGETTNANFTNLVQAIAGRSAIDFPTDADLSLTLTAQAATIAQSARSLMLFVTSSAPLTATRTLYVPAYNKVYIIANNTTGGQALNIVSGSPNIVQVPWLGRVAVYVDGTNVYELFNYTSFFRTRQLQVDDALNVTGTVNVGQLVESRGVGMLNRIINGTFQVDTREPALIGSVLSSTPRYAVDRWYLRGDTNTSTVYRYTSGSPDALRNIGRSLRIQSGGTGTPLAGHINALTQKIEYGNVYDNMWGTSQAIPMRLSFYAVSNLSGTYAVRLNNLGTGSAQRSFVQTFSLTSGSWTQVTILVPGDISSPTYWRPSAFNAAGLSIDFDLGSGSDFNAPSAGTWLAGDYRRLNTCVSLISNSSASLDVTGVQLTLGSAQLPLEMRTYVEEERLCARYFQRVGFVSLYNYAPGVGAYPLGTISLGTQMRAYPFTASLVSNTSTNLTGGVVTASSSADRRSIVVSGAAAGTGLFGSSEIYGTVDSEL